LVKRPVHKTIHKQYHVTLEVRHVTSVNALRNVR